MAEIINSELNLMDKDDTPKIDLDALVAQIRLAEVLACAEIAEQNHCTLAARVIAAKIRARLEKPLDSDLASH